MRGLREAGFELNHTRFCCLLPLVLFNCQGCLLLLDEKTETFLHLSFFQFTLSATPITHELLALEEKQRAK